MAEAAKQFFVGFLHPRTWLAALIGIVAAVLVALGVSGALGSFLGTLISSLTGGSVPSAYIEATGIGIFAAMLTVYAAIVAGSLLPLLVLVSGAVVAGLIFGLTSKKERVASKSIIGGLNIGLIYIAIVVIVFVFWVTTFSSITSLYNAIVIFLQALPVDILVSFLIVWWVSAIISIIILSMKHD